MKKKRERCAWCTPNEYVINPGGVLPLCKAHGKMIDNYYGKSEEVKESIEAGEIWREIKHELESKGVIFPINFDVMGACYGAYVIIGNALKRAKK